MTDFQQLVDQVSPALHGVYTDLHSHPELSGQEQRTAGVAAAALRAAGYEVTEGIGGHGVAGVLRNGEGPTVWLRADMDALPVKEDTGLPYASTVTARDEDGNEVSVAHACGHDMHTTCLIGAIEVLAGTTSDWSGTVVAVFQPAEEIVDGARQMLADGLLDKVPSPDVVLGQHVAPLPAGAVFYMPGSILAAVDNMEIVLYGKGGHGSRPETTIDPVVMAASLILRLQTVVAREIAPADQAVITVGSVVSGTQDNIIPDEATLKLTVRSFVPAVRDKLLASIERIAKAEAMASGAERQPTIRTVFSSPTTDNDPAATALVATAFTDHFGSERTYESPRPGTGSEDFGLYGTAAGVPSVFWFLGGADPQLFAPPADLIRVLESLPSNHSPFYAPVIEPTINTGVAALVTAARVWLVRPE